MQAGTNDDRCVSGNQRWLTEEDQWRTRGPRPRSERRVGAVLPLSYVCPGCTEGGGGGSTDHGNW